MAAPRFTQDGGMLSRQPIVATAPTPAPVYTPAPMPAPVYTPAVAPAPTPAPAANRTTSSLFADFFPQLNTPAVPNIPLQSAPTAPVAPFVPVMPTPVAPTAITPPAAFTAPPAAFTPTPTPVIPAPAPAPVVPTVDTQAQALQAAREQKASPIAPEITDVTASSFDENSFISSFDEPVVDLPQQVKTEATPPVVDINKKIATNKYGGALKYSELSPEDQAVVDARRAAATAPTVEPYKGVERQDYGEAPKTETPEEALNNYTNFFSDVQTQMEETNKEYSLTNYDPSEFVRAGFSAGKDVVGKAAGTDVVVDYITKNDIPVSKEINGQEVYLTTGLGEDVLSKTVGDEYKGEGSYEAQGPVGTYSTVYVPPESVLNDPVLSVAGMFFPPVQVFTTAVKLGTGESVSPLEIATAGLNSLELAGIIKPPVPAGASTIDPTNIAAVSGDAALDAYSAATQGTGLFGLGYNATKNLVKAAASDNLVEGVVQAFGAPIVEEFISNLPQTDLTDLAAKAGVQADDLASGLNTAISKLAGGSNLEDALKAGAIDYIKEGGSLPDIIPEFVKEAGRALEDTVRVVGSFLDNEVFQNIKDIAPDLSGIEDAFREGGSALNDFVQPAIDKVQEEAPKIEDAVREVGSTIDDVLEPVYKPIVDVAPVIEDVARAVGPSIEDMLKAILGGVGVGGMLATQQTQQPAATRTTDSLFGDELFKFKTQVGADMPELVKLQRRYQA
jgi:hypothetical protein